MSQAIGASFRRFRTVFWGDLAYHTRRPLFIVWALIVIWTAWGFSGGKVRIQSGDATVGGTKAYITSEFAVAMQLAILTTLLSGFFVAVAAGMTIIQDQEWRLERTLAHDVAAPARIHLGQVCGRARRLRDHPGDSTGRDGFLLPSSCRIPKPRSFADRSMCSTM